MLPKIELPTSKVVLPSTKKTVTIRPFTVREEKVLLIAKQSGQYSDVLNAMKQVVRNCILEEINIDKLAIFDIEYLFMKLRSMSVNNLVKVSYLDNEDQQTYDFEIDLDKIEVKFPEKTVKMIVLNDEYSMSMKYPEASLYSSKDFTSESEEANLNVFLMATVDKLFKGDKMTDLASSPPDEIMKFIDDLPVKAYEQIKQFWADLPKLNHELSYTNKNGKEQKIVLNKLTDFFSL